MCGVSPAKVVAFIALVVLLAAAVSIDVVKTMGVKSDEATYVMMALSVAYDHDLAYQRRDLERYVGMYRWGPDGLFLKRGKQLRLAVDSTRPFIHLVKRPDRQADRLYFGKAIVYPIVAAPFVRLLGLNGIFVLHVLLMFLACACAYTFLAATSQPTAALVYTLAFVGASCVPIYLVFLTPEIFHFTLVVVAYFLWLYKEVRPDGGYLLFRSKVTDILAAILLGIATYSKPSHGLLIAPIVLSAWWRREYVRGVVAGAVCVATAATLFGVTALVSGEFNYQGGDRKTFIGRFPFDGSPEDAWYARGQEMSTNDADTESVLRDFPNRFSHNVEYFLVGRHFGFVPYFFPGVIAVALWLLSRERRQLWRLLIFVTVVASAVGLLVFFPYSWSGGGGPLVNPFAAAMHPNDIASKGFARRLPVEITMANDLPIMLEGPRAHEWYSDVLLYFLDEHAYFPEEIGAHHRKGIWIAGDGRADILVRCEWPIDHLQVTAESPIATTFVVSMGAGESRVALLPGKPATFDVKASGVRDQRSYAYLLSARSTEGFTPRLHDASSTDFRNLGVLMRFTAIPAQQ